MDAENQEAEILIHVCEPVSIDVENDLRGQNNRQENVIKENGVFVTSDVEIYGVSDFFQIQTGIHHSKSILLSMPQNDLQRKE